MQVNLEYKQEKKIFFKLHLVFSTPRKAFIYGLFRNFSSYSNSSLPSCYMVFFVGFNGRNQGVLSAFYLLRGFLEDCIVILLSVTLPLLPLSFIMQPLYILTPSTIYFISLFKCLFSTFHNIDYVIMCFL